MSINSSIKQLIEQCPLGQREEILKQLKVKVERRNKIKGWIKEGKYITENEYQAKAQYAGRHGMSVTDYLISLGYVANFFQKGRPRKYPKVHPENYPINGALSFEEAVKKYGKM